MAKYLLTGVAGFIAARTAELLLEEGHEIVGIDNLNDYYDVRLKQWRIDRLEGHENSGQFAFRHLDVENLAELENLFRECGPCDAVLNLAARAGVRYSM